MSLNLDKRAWKVAPLSFDKASILIKLYHYSHSHSKQSVALHGLFLMQDDYNVLPYGVCWWIPPPSPSVARYCSPDFEGVLSLSRMILTPDAPRNAASFLLSRSIKLLPEQYHTLVTYADTWQGHTGGIYRATNWHYDGLTDKKPVYVDNEGAMVSTRKGDKTISIQSMNQQYTLLGHYSKHRFIFYRQKLNENIQREMFQS